VSTLILNFLLIPRLGIIGAGLAMSTSLCVTAAVLIAIFTRRTGASLRETLIVNRDDFRMYRVKIKEGLRYVRRRLSRERNVIPPLNGRGE
jgi:Na+-driven multidrug efflux pump